MRCRAAGAIGTVTVAAPLSASRHQLVPVIQATPPVRRIDQFKNHNCLMPVTSVCNVERDGAANTLHLSGRGNRQRRAILFVKTASIET